MDDKSNVESWANQFMSEFEKETDRASIIVAASILDTALESIMKRFLVPIPSSTDTLLDSASNAPISSFDARINLAHRLGLISAKFCRDLHLIRKMRNDVAHKIEQSSFQNESVRNRASELVRSVGLYHRLPDEYKAKFPKGIRTEFQITVSSMIWLLWGFADIIQSLKPIDLEWFYNSSAAGTEKK